MKVGFFGDKTIISMYVGARTRPNPHNVSALVSTETLSYVLGCMGGVGTITTVTVNGIVNCHKYIEIIENNL